MAFRGAIYIDIDNELYWRVGSTVRTIRVPIQRGVQLYAPCDHIFVTSVAWSRY